MELLSFIGTSANARTVQVRTTLIAIALLKYRQLRPHFAGSLSKLVTLLRTNLFTHRDRWTGLEQPFEGPPNMNSSHFAPQAAPGLVTPCPDSTC